MEFFMSLKEEVLKNKINLIVSLFLLLLILLSNIILYFSFINKKEVIDNKDLLVSNEIDSNITKQEDNKPLIYKVDVKGRVKKPGVYELNEGSRVIDAINKAGGLLDNADTSVTNLSKLLKDSMVIVVYSREEVSNFSKIKEKEQQESKECITYNENIKNDSCKDNDVNKEDLNTKDDNVERDIKVSINTATLEELVLIPGIGESKAKSIIEYRNNVGEFKTIEDITKVSGIGDTVFEKIKEYITVE